MGATEFIALSLLEDAFLFTRRLMIKRARMGWWILSLLYASSYKVRFACARWSSCSQNLRSLIYFKFQRFYKTRSRNKSRAYNLIQARWARLIFHPHNFLLIFDKNNGREKSSPTQPATWETNRYRLVTDVNRLIKVLSIEVDGVGRRKWNLQITNS